MNKLIVPQWPLPKGVAAYSSTRIDGVSLLPYDSLSLGVHYGDNPDRVEGSRKRLFTAGNLPSKPVWPEQAYGKDVFKLIGKPYASKRADASYSSMPDTVCVMVTADCLPVLFCNRVGTGAVAVHTGWYGLCVGVLGEMISRSADNPENILAWLGPATDLRTFEVEVEVREAFMAIDAEANAAFIQYDDKYLADTYQLARRHLTSVGVERIFGGDHCAYTEDETFFSYHRDKTTGHMTSFIWLI